MNQHFHLQVHRLHLITETEYGYLWECSEQRRELAQEKQTLQAHCTAQDIEIDTLAHALEEANKTIDALRAQIMQRDLYAELAEQNRITAEQLDLEKVLTPQPVNKKRTRKEVLTPEKEIN